MATKPVATQPDARALARELVDKLEALSTAAPTLPRGTPREPSGEPFSGNVRFELWDPRVMLENAARFVSPRLPAEASFRSVKALLLRVLRIVTRDQTAFNSVLIEAIRAALTELENGSMRIDQALMAERGARGSAISAVELRFEQESARVRNLELAQAEDVLQRELEASKREELGRELEAAQKRLDELERDRDRRAERLARALEAADEAREKSEKDARSLHEQLRTIRLEWTSLRHELKTQRSQTLEPSPGREAGTAPLPSTAAGSPAAMSPADPLRAGLYADFEERFRGSEEEILKRQEADVALFRGAPGPVADLGCGRGEFVQALVAAGIPAVGCDANPVMAQRAREKGLPVDQEDLFTWLAAKGDGTLGGIAAYQVVEHLPPSALFDLVDLAVQKLAPGGRLLFETINPESVYAMRWFWMDLTHVRPVPAPSLQQLMEVSGLRDVRIDFRSPVPSHESVSEEIAGPLALSPVTRLLFGPQDYAIWGTK